MKYSIITATYNAEKHLARLISSICTQSYPNIEWIVQDGGSTDGTLPLLKKIGSRVRYASEPDSGVYDAWNKALLRATGDWIIFLGADDCFIHKDVIAQCHRHIRNLPETVDIAYGALVLGRNGATRRMINRSLRDVYHLLLSDMGIPFPASFIRGPVVRKTCFDPSFKIAGDYDLAARVITHENLARLPVLVTYMEEGGISANPKDCSLLEERVRVLFKSVSPKAQEFLWGCAENIMNEDYSLEQTFSE